MITICGSRYAELRARLNEMEHEEILRKVKARQQKKKYGYILADSMTPHDIDKLELDTLYKYPHPIRRFSNSDTLYDRYKIIERKRTIKVRDVIYIPADLDGRPTVIHNDESRKSTV